MGEDRGAVAAGHWLWAGQGLASGKLLRRGLRVLWRQLFPAARGECSADRRSRAAAGLASGIFVSRSLGDLRPTPRSEAERGSPSQVPWSSRPSAQRRVHNTSPERQRAGLTGDKSAQTALNAK